MILFYLIIPLRELKNQINNEAVHKLPPLLKFCYKLKSPISFVEP